MPPSLNGALVIDKPSGPSSHDVVARVKRATGAARVGHTGTLDPLATGVLPLLAGRATRLARFLAAGDKAYEARIRLGVTTATYDAASPPVTPAGNADGSGAAVCDRGSVEAALGAFRGVILQTPPPYSAKRIGGVRAYELARRRAPVQPAPATVTVHALDVVHLDGTALDIRVVCSAGFYVRSLAHDLGVRLGCGAHLETLRRTRAGHFGLDQAVPLALIEELGAGAAVHVIPLAELLPDVPCAVLTDRGAGRAAHGNAITPSDITGAMPSRAFRSGSEGGQEARCPVRLFDGGGAMVAIAVADARGVLHPVVVLV
jgi:tRNA pseudouridine55 synthase